MTETFKHKFFGGLEAEARRHINPDGSQGGIVAVTARIADGVTIRASTEVGPHATISDGASIGNWVRIGSWATIGARATIGAGAWIGAGASIGIQTSIGIRTNIGNGAWIGSRASINDGASIENGEWFTSCGPQGSRSAMLTAVQKPEGLRWWVGCKHGITTDLLRAYVAETHGDNNHAQDYLHVIAFVESHPARLRAIAGGAE